MSPPRRDQRSLKCARHDSNPILMPSLSCFRVPSGLISAVVPNGRLGLPAHAVLSHLTPHRRHGRGGADQPAGLHQ